MKTMTEGRQRWKKKRTSVPTAAGRKPHLCERSEGKLRVARGCFLEEQTSPARRSQVRRERFHSVSHMMMSHLITHRGPAKHSFISCSVFLRSFFFCPASQLMDRKNRSRRWEERLLRAQRGRRIDRPRSPHRLVRLCRHVTYHLGCSYVSATCIYVHHPLWVTEASKYFFSFLLLFCA